MWNVKWEFLPQSLFNTQLMTILVLIEMVSIILDMFHRKISLKFVLLLLLLNFKIDEYFPHPIMGQALSPRFSAVCATAMAHRNHFFCFNQVLNLLHLKWSSERLLIVAKEFLKPPTLLMLIKQKNLSLPEAWLSQLLANCWYCFQQR